MSYDSATMTQPETLIIEPALSRRNYWRDLWRYRELFYILAWRDIAVRYKQTVIGVVWAIIQPLATVVVFTLVFGRLAKLPSSSEDVPYALMVFAGLLPWQLFAGIFSGASGSLIGNVNLISKVYFPRLMVPTARGAVSFVDFLIGLVIFFALMAWYHFAPGWQLFALPLFVIMAILASIGPGLWASALTVKYRDFVFITPFVVQLGQFVSPVGFSSGVVSERWLWLYSINPMVGVINGFRWALLGGESQIYLPGFLISWAVIVIFLWLGVRRFRKMEQTFADII